MVEASTEPDGLISTTTTSDNGLLLASSTLPVIFMLERSRAPAALSASSLNDPLGGGTGDSDVVGVGVGVAVGVAVGVGSGVATGVASGFATSAGAVSAGAVFSGVACGAGDVGIIGVVGSGDGVVAAGSLLEAVAGA